MKQISYNKLEIIKHNLNSIDCLFDSDEWFIKDFNGLHDIHYGSSDVLDDLELSSRVINEHIEKYDIDLDIDVLFSDQFQLLSKTLFYYKQIENDEICMCCHEILKTDIYRLDCGHYIHIECFETILKFQNADNSINIFTKCPYCSSKITIDNKLFIKNSESTTIITSNMCKYQIDAILIKNLMVAYEKLCFFKIRVLMYQNSLKIIDNLIYLENGDRSRIKETESSRFKQITDMFKFIKHKNTSDKIFTNIDKWYNIWNGNDNVQFINGSAPYVQTSLYKLLLTSSFMFRSKNTQEQNEQLINHMLLKYTIYKNDYIKWCNWIQTNVPHSPLLIPSSDDLLNYSKNKIKPIINQFSDTWLTDTWCSKIDQLLNQTNIDLFANL